MSRFSRHFSLFTVLVGCTAITFLAVIKDEHLVAKITLLLFFILLLYTVYAIRKNARLIEVSVANPPLRLIKILEGEIANSGWRLLRSNKQYLTALKPGEWKLGGRVAVLCHKNSIFINVQNDEGYRGYFPFSFGKNKRVADKFIGIIKDADQNLSS